MKRIEREKIVVRKMISLYCRAHHLQTKENLCQDCRKLYDYAEARLNSCPKGNQKSSCRICEIHCYAREYKDKIREVMRYAGPRMMFRHPLTTIRHIISEHYNVFHI